MQVDTVKLIKKCDKCQRFGNVQRLPTKRLTTITPPWPFAQWGIDIVDPLPLGKGQVRFLLVAIDYFTKWVEAEALTTITEARIQSFVRKSIICRFGIPRMIVSDNRWQFDNQAFKDFYSDLWIKNQFSSLGHLQANGQKEVMNRTLLKIIKAKLDNAKGAWPEEFPNVLWAYRTTARTLTREIPFRRMVFNKEDNDDHLWINLNCLDKVRDKASKRMTKYQQKMAEYYNRRVKLRQLDIGDLVLRKVTSVTKESA